MGAQLSASPLKVHIAACGGPVLHGRCSIERPGTMDFGSRG